MSVRPFDLAQVRLDNALRLFDEFVAKTVSHPDATTLRGLERRFAERMQIQPSYWSQIKSRSRQIGERLARQFEQLAGKPFGWMDTPHGLVRPEPASNVVATKPAAAPPPQDAYAARDDDERFILGLVITYYRRNPQRAKTRLLELLSEVLVSPDAEMPHGERATPPQPPLPNLGSASRPPVATLPSGPPSADLDFAKSQQGITPLKRRR
ncbi:hypothetical protein [Piscinibacterium candidicorallinum]|uniref:Uncharacterized protein n=1 Tax=Piscinibacterium candidicorallinum TaxID=1793872 RepID=A0ABV7H846_9BURK